MIYRFASIAILLLFVVFSLTGCGAFAISPVTGVLISNVSAPVDVASGAHKPMWDVKVGTGSVTSVFGLFAFGDASIRSAARGAGIQQIHYVDYNTKMVMGVVAIYTVYVYGE